VSASFNPLAPPLNQRCTDTDPITQVTSRIPRFDYSGDARNGEQQRCQHHCSPESNTVRSTQCQSCPHRGRRSCTMQFHVQASSMPEYKRKIRTKSETVVGRNRRSSFHESFSASRLYDSAALRQTLQTVSGACCPAAVIKTQLFLGQTPHSFNGWHEPDKSRGLRPESVSGSGRNSPGRLGEGKRVGYHQSVPITRPSSTLQARIRHITGVEAEYAAGSHG
jgi:hypothetical protein